MVGDLVRQVQGQQNAQSGQTPATTPPAGTAPGGPGEPTQGSPYGQQGMYNTLATDMSRGFMGNYGFGGNQFGYQPYGNPYQQQSFGGMFGRGGYGGGWGGPPPPIMGGGYSPMQRFGGSVASMMGNFNPTIGQGYSNMYGGNNRSSGFLNSMAQRVPGVGMGGYGGSNMGGGMMGNHQYNPTPNDYSEGSYYQTGGYGKPTAPGGGTFGRRSIMY
jgi:hypothetical protein